MIELGRKQTLIVAKQVDFGVYLYDGENKEDTVLLPLKQVPEGTKPGDSLEVFLYRDSKDRLIATTNEPYLELGGLAVLKVAETTKIGAFLDWGLEKDLLLPFKKQTSRVREGEECLVTLYVDKSGRLCADMNVYEVLRKDAPYEEGEHVTGRIYESSDNFGMFVAVDDQYSALIPKRDCQGDLKVGDIIQARITRIHPDGRMDLSVREKAYLQIETDARMILEVLDEFSGVLPFNDKASPEVIKREFGLSKAAFKRAVGRLLKEGAIEITPTAIKKRI
ncbi:MAG: RNA-binding protein [Lachnospiraceae bacterium]|nr:RNA-binding protein [Lachnospiraceae bacterium]